MLKLTPYYICVPHVKVFNNEMYPSKFINSEMSLQTIIIKRLRLFQTNQKCVLHNNKYMYMVKST